MKHYYNTNHESGETLEASIEKAAKQEDIIMEFMQKHPKEMYTPCEIHQLIRSKGPLTSTRRAVTNLTQQGKLVKRNTQKQGVFGKKVYCWYYAPPGHQIEIM